MELQSEATFFPQCVLNCGVSGMARWGCGEVELLAMLGILYLVAELRFWQASGRLLPIPRECLTWLTVHKRGMYSCHW